MAEYAWIDCGNGRQVYRRVDQREPLRSPLPFPYLALDTMDAVQSMVDGRMYDSKSAIRAHYREAGVEEVGNDPARFRAPPKPKPDRRKIKDALERAEARVRRGETPA